MHRYRLTSFYYDRMQPYGLVQIAGRAKIIFARQAIILLCHPCMQTKRSHVGSRVDPEFVKKGGAMYRDQGNMYR